MQEPLVSAIITTHNRCDLCMDALKSVIDQTYKNIEVILVDDASDEPMDEALNTDEFRTVHYTYISKSESKGGNHARNVGIGQATGEYIAFLDDDDLWLPEKIEKQVAFLEAHPECGIVACARIFEYDFQKSKPESLENLLSGNLSQRIFIQMPYTTSSLLVRKDILSDAGCFDEELRFWQDYELLIRLSQTTNIGVVPEHLLVYHVFHQDKARLTNNLHGWEDAVNYIGRKYGNVIEKLPENIRRQHEAMIALDGAKRAKRLAETKICRKYLRKVLFAQPCIRNFVKYIFNICRVDQ